MTNTQILPGATIGIIGGGQLGRMMAIAARRLGYGIIGLDPDDTGPLAQVADFHIAAGYDDLAAAEQLANSCDIITLEFENIPAETLAHLESRITVAPGPEVLATCRHRLTEKTFLNDNGFPVTQFAAARSEDELRTAIETIGLPVIVKTVEFGYDGKGQVRIDDIESITAAWQQLGDVLCIVEKVVTFEREASVICQRNADGDISVFPTFENDHRNHILDITRMPARLPAITRKAARELAHNIAEKLQVIGTICVELFISESPNGRTLIVNELAPRPHNSGHITIDACVTCQFEQHIRAICNLPFGDTTPTRGGGAMVNLLSDEWENGEPHWAGALASHGDVKLHLYGKAEAKVGRKMGHINCSAADPDAAARSAIAARLALQDRPE